MKEFEFTGHAARAFAAIKSGLKGISFGYIAGQQIIEVCLWLITGGHVRIRSGMHDVSDRFEVGVLDITLLARTEESNAIVLLDGSFLGDLAIEKCVLDDSEVRAESGIIIRAADGAQMTIVAAAAPCTLFVLISGIELPSAQPEYPLGDYLYVPL